MSQEFEHFVGIDWGTAHHQVSVLDREGRQVGKRRVANDGAGLRALIELCGTFTTPAVGIETPRGALVETLLGANVAVFHINPKQADRFRDRHTAAGSKDDTLDAFSIADALRTDMHCFRRVEPTPEAYVELQELSRIDTTLTTDCTRAQNRLREELLRLHPPLLTLCNGSDELWFWALVGKVVQSATPLRRAQVAAILAHHRIRKVTADQVVEVLHQSGFTVSPGTRRAVAQAVPLLVAQLELLDRQQKQVAKQTAALLDQLAQPNAEDESSEHRDVAILRSMPGVGVKTAAAMLAEVPQFLRDRNYPALRAIAGVAPVTDATGKRSGKRAKVHMRKGCRNRLRNVVHMWAFGAIAHDEDWNAYYAKVRAGGANHNQALRSVGDRLLRVTVGALKAGRPYDRGVLYPAPSAAPSAATPA